MVTCDADILGIHQTIPVVVEGVIDERSVEEVMGTVTRSANVLSIDRCFRCGISRLTDRVTKVKHVARFQTRIGIRQGRRLQPSVLLATR